MSKEDIEKILKNLKFGHPDTRRAAAVKLGRIRVREVIPDLIETIKNDKDRLVRTSALQSLLWIADDTIIVPIEQVILTDPDDLVKKTAINILGSMKSKHSLIMLKSLAQDNSTSLEVKEAIRNAIKQINGDS